MGSATTQATAAATTALAAASTVDIDTAPMIGTTEASSGTAGRDAGAHGAGSSSGCSHGSPADIP